MRSSVQPFCSVTFLLLILQLSIASAQDRRSRKPAYAGTVQYSQGGFGGYNAPVKGDSILVFLDALGNISLTVFPVKEPGNLRHLNVLETPLKQIKKTEYLEIQTPTQTRHTGNYNLKYASGKEGGDSYTLQLIHRSEGNTADLILQSEYNGFMYDICIGSVWKLNK